MPIGSTRYILGFLCWISSWLVCEQSFAIRQYRCNGMIQYRPCETDPANRSAFQQPIKYDQVKTKVGITGPRYAKVQSQHFSKDSPGHGLWKGVIKGNGFVELSLNIFRNGQLESTRFMGHLWLANKDSTYRFRSTLPAGKDWTWKVEATAS